MLLSINLFSNALFTVVVIITMSIFFDKRRVSLPVAIFLYTLGCMLTSSTIIFEYILGHEPVFYVMIRIFLVTTALFLVTLSYKSTIRKTVAVISFMMFLLFAVQQFAWLISEAAYATLLGVELYYAITADGELSAFIVTLSIQTVVAIITVLIFWVKFKGIKKNLFNMPTFWILPLVMFVIVEATMILAALNLNQIATAVVNSVLVILCFVILYLHDTLSANFEEKLHSVRQEQEKEYYYTQCKLMQESAEQVKAMRHDIKSHMAALRDFAANGSMEDIKNYLDGLVDGTEEIYSKTGNIAFDSIINYKLRNADDIKLDLNIAVPPEVNIEVGDIVTVLGNILDNALEAAAKAHEKFIKLDIEYVKGGLFAKMDNSFNGEIKYSAENDEQPVSLKSGAEHGYGLKNIRQTVEKYNGHMKISHTENVFSIGVFLYTE